MKTFVQSLRIFLVLTLLVGVVYPVAVTLYAQLIVPEMANGSLIYRQNRIVGSTLLAQKFTSPQYFQERPSAADYNALASSGSNFSATSAEMKKQILERQNLLKEEFSIAYTPQDLLTSSASGLDPHISFNSAQLQIEKIAKTRGLQVGQVKALLERYFELPQFGFLGEPRVNVLRLNIALDEVK